MNLNHNFSIYTALESYRNSITNVGEIHILLDGKAFPDREWTDFGFTVIPWWTEEIKNLVNDVTKIAKCEFMDGSYRFDIVKLNKVLWEIILIKEFADSEKILLKGKTHPEAVLTSLLKTTKLLSTSVKELVPEKFPYWNERINWLNKTLELNESAN